MKSFKHYLLIIAICLLPFVTVFATPLMIHTHDGPMHIARIPAYLRAITGGQIPPRWADMLNYGYGMPLFNFYYHMPYLLGSALFSLGFSLAWTFKLLLLLSYLLSGCFMYLFANALFKDRTKALVSAVLYQFAPFHLVDLVVRGDIGETLAMAFLPLVLYCTIRIFESDGSGRYVMNAGIATALMILSHSAIGLMYFSVSVLFVLLFAPNNKKRIQGFLGLATGLLLTAFFWIPVLAERKYTYGDLFMKDMYKTHFVPLWKFFVPNITNAPFLQIGGVDISFGLLQSVSLIIALRLLFRKKLNEHTRTLTIFGLLTAAGTLFIMSGTSAFLWDRISMLRAFQFPWRFLNVTIFSLSLLGGAVLIGKKSPHTSVTVLIAATILSTIVYWKPPLGFDSIDEQYFIHYPLDTTFFGETNVIWSAGPADGFAKAPFELIAGKGEIRDAIKRQTTHTFTVVAETDVQVKDNTQYYPGWRAYRDGIKLPIEFQDQNHRGTITFSLPPGTHHVTVSFHETPIRAAADLISVVTALAMVFAYILNRKRTS